MIQARFVGQDEIPLLARGLQQCYTTSELDQTAYALDQLRRDVNEQDVWWGASMVAEVSDQVAAVLIAARRENTAFIYRMAVQDTYKGRGLEAQMLEKLSAKMASHGVERIIAEVPLDGPEWVFEQQGYEPMTQFQDLILTSPPCALTASNPLQECPVEELLAYPGLQSGEIHAWSRSYRTLHNRRADLRGMGLAVKGRLMAALIYDRDNKDGYHNLWRFGRITGGHGLAALGLLVRTVVVGLEGPVRIPKMYGGEVPPEMVVGWGFRPVRTYLRYRAFLKKPKGETP